MCVYFYVDLKGITPLNSDCKGDFDHFNDLTEKVAV